MKRYGTNWVLRGLLAALIVSGMAMSASSAGAVSHLGGCNDENTFPARTAALTVDSPLSSLDWESLSVADLSEMALDDTSRDSMDDFHPHSQLFEHVSFRPELRHAAGRSLEQSAETGLSTRMISCVWRC